MHLYVSHRFRIHLCLLGWGSRKERVHLQTNLARAVKLGLFGARSTSVVAIAWIVQAYLDALADEITITALNGHHEGRLAAHSARCEQVL